METHRSYENSAVSLGLASLLETLWSAYPLETQLSVVVTLVLWELCGLSVKFLSCEKSAVSFCQACLWGFFCQSLSGLSMGTLLSVFVRLVYGDSSVSLCQACLWGQCGQSLSGLSMGTLLSVFVRLVYGDSSVSLCQACLWGQCGQSLSGLSMGTLLTVFVRLVYGDSSVSLCQACLWGLFCQSLSDLSVGTVWSVFVRLVCGDSSVSLSLSLFLLVSGNSFVSLCLPCPLGTVLSDLVMVIGRLSGIVLGQT